MTATGGWIGVDLDGTLAHYEGWKGADYIGAPIPGMVSKVRNKILEGFEVRIFTARVADGNVNTRQHIEKWCLEHLGQVLKVTNVKDFGMIELWDDRAVQVIPNTGIFLADEFARRCSEGQA
jgi:hypothetical protein